jgi:hypothetical protein
MLRVLTNFGLAFDDSVFSCISGSHRGNCEELYYFIIIIIIGGVGLSP